MIQYRELTQPAEIERAVDLEAQVWQMDDRQVIPASMMIALQHTGGHLGGAFDGERLIGFSVAFVARQGRETFLWSHMAAVHPDYQTRKIGFGLKQEQRRWALSNGFARIGWTFDPLLRLNANFNLRRLGATANAFHVDLYGEMQDGLNRGLPSDRLEVSWELASARVNEHANPEQEALPVMMDIRNTGFLLVKDDNDYPHVQGKPDAMWHFVEIPTHIDGIKQRDPALALAWRIAMREVFVDAFAQGYSAIDFVNTASRCWYVLFNEQFNAGG